MINDQCYLRETASCSSTISAEHSVSRAVLKNFGERQVRVSGFHWLKGTEKVIGIESLVARHLCTAHNSALSPLDDAAGRFFRAIADCNARAKHVSRTYLFNGHDIERWMLKVLTGLAASKSFTVGGEHLTQNFHPLISPIELLEAPLRWPRHTGLYLVQQAGEKYQHQSQFSLAPIYQVKSKDLGGLYINIQGLRFVLQLYPLDRLEGSGMERHCFRPTALNYRGRGKHCTIRLSWLNGLRRAGVEILALPDEV